MRYLPLIVEGNFNVVLVPYERSCQVARVVVLRNFMKLS